MKGLLVLEMVIIIVALFLVATSLYVSGILVDAFQASDKMNQTFMQNADDSLNVINSMFPFLLVGMMMAAAISAYMLREHPVFAIFSIILWIFMIVVAAIFSNTFEALGDSTVFAPAAAQFTLTQQVMDYLPVLMTVFGAVVVIFLYAKSRDDV